MRIYNFSHKVSYEVELAILAQTQERAQITGSAAPKSIDQVVIPCQLDLSGDLKNQCDDLLVQVGYSPDGWSIILPPAHSAAAFYMGARLASAQSDAYPPQPASFGWLVRDGQSLPPKFILGGIVW